MAVRHGYGKIAGTDALVFAYDTGDTRNSYKGEPTVNLLPNGVAAGHNSGTYGNVVTVTDATAEKGPGWKKVTISNRGSNSRIIQWTYLSMSANIMYCHSAVFDWGNMRDKGYYINHDGNGTGQRFFYKPGDYTTNQGASISINSTLADGKIAGNITHTTSHTHAFFINNNTTGVSGINDYFYYKEFQVEVNSHPTPYTTGTRSATQGLLDLTGRNTVDLTNVSFDSNAQMTFDGTNDYFVAGEEAFRFGNTFSLEFVMYWDGVDHTNDNIMGKRNGPVDSYSQYSVFVNNGNYTTGGTGKVLSFFGRADGNTADIFLTHTLTSTPGYKHVIIAIAASSQAMYVNGTQVTSSTVNLTGRTYNITTGGNRDFLVGAVRDNDGTGILNAANFTIPVVKAYNRALTAAEVRNNYNQYKGRFNI